MGKRFNSDEMQKVFEILQESYDVYGPRIYQGTGCFSDTDVIRYGRLDSWKNLSGIRSRITVLKKHCFQSQRRFFILQRMR